MHSVRSRLAMFLGLLLGYQTTFLVWKLSVNEWSLQEQDIGTRYSWNTDLHSPEWTNKTARSTGQVTLTQRNRLSAGARQLKMNGVFVSATWSSHNGRILSSVWSNLNWDVKAMVTIQTLQTSGYKTIGLQIAATPASAGYSYSRVQMTCVKLWTCLKARNFCISFVLATFTWPVDTEDVRLIGRIGVQYKCKDSVNKIKMRVKENNLV